MVTRLSYQKKLGVRFLLPPPIFVFLSILLLSGSSWAADVAVSPVNIDNSDSVLFYGDTLAAAVSSPESLSARVVGGDIFGIYWSSFGGNGKISEADGFSMVGRADGVQDLATATYSTFKGVEKAIAELSVTDPVLLDWLEKIYDQLYTSTRSGDVVTKTSVADLVASLLSVNEIAAWDVNQNVFVGKNIADLLALITRNQHFSTAATFTLGADGMFSSTPIALGNQIGRGFLGLARLMFGDAGRDIVGLGTDAKIRSGQRGNWSLADISANGFLGLARLIGNDYVDGKEVFWTWTDPADPSHVISHEVSSLFDLFFEIQTLQSSLAKLEYVYASKEDIEFKDQEKPNMDAVKDNFFGDGEGAVNPDQIKDAAGLSSGIKDSFGGAGSPGDAFAAINDSNSFWFFSQEVADDLDTMNSPAVALLDDADPFEGLVLDEDGFYSLIDLSPWDVSSYLGSG